MKATQFCFVFLLLLLLTACDSGEHKNATVLKNSNCEPNLECIYPNNVKVWLSHQSLSPETPFTIFSKLPDDIKITQAKLKGITMYMGFIPQQFVKQGDLWKSETMVGICSENNMLWNLELTVINTTTSKEDTLNYNFYVTY
ncbi:hypothetical protein KZZ04_10395 [Pseudoalteromonas sp. CR1]|uniref:hypothetical protein n=1 Tax=Pseudoalteromonas sp. CR1 TaxID=2861964 RepID=UPI001C5EEC7E|nr:hypothetical protein [Pseudoalteromonas sp. CR1]MBW4966774.1 hypothetical protein [Pseudoalteromonas sp. CR1]|tara:strand:- start:471 stop:896 length:426 start_codon:yes stop_codon:yes gene_type:complete